MFGVIFLLLIVVPLVELYVIVQVAQGFGALPTIALLLIISTLGAWLVRREGTGVFARIQEQLFGGKLPSKEIADGALIMFGGTLLLTPGFVTDAIGLSLLIPPIRAVVRGVLLKRFEAKRTTMTTQFTKTHLGGFSSTGTQGFGGDGTRFTAGFGFPNQGASRQDDVIEVDVTRVDDPSIQPRELGTDTDTPDTPDTKAP